MKWGLHKARVLSVGKTEPIEPGWVNDAPFTDTEPKPPFQIAPEIAAMFETMQRNFLTREARLMEEISKQKPAKAR